MSARPVHYASLIRCMYPKVCWDWVCLVSAGLGQGA